jgi:hypothetical protein
MNKREYRLSQFTHTSELLRSCLNVPWPNTGPCQLPIVRNDLAKLFARLKFTRGAEIGVANGSYSALLLTTIPNLHLTSVDPWALYPEDPRHMNQDEVDKSYERTVLQLSRFVQEGRSLIVRALSMDAVRDIPKYSLDFVYIDGNHCFDYVMQDVIEWSMRVRCGGIVSGDDYYDFQRAGVVPAVDTYTRAHSITEWYTTSDRNRSKHFPDRLNPSFFWVKPW